MVTIIKNQLLKHLSRFTKNLSPEQISVSALKGQGCLSSLQLDEAVLTELLELPPWMRLASATCGYATFRVHWTKLKNQPIELNLEDVQIIVETCSELRGGTGSSPITSPSVPPARYSFIHKVIDGISITVNTVKIQFTTPVFVATVQMSRISVESRTPQWQKGDLRLTRLKDPRTSQILIFKEVSWQSARIEAHAIHEGGGLPPLRLLTNQAFCRITIKKRLSDCFVVGSRLVLILEEALWVLTDRQLGAALAFADSLAGLARSASAQVTREKAQRKLETLPEYLAQVSQSQGRAQNPTPKGRSNDTLSKLFSHHDVSETSYHFLSQKIDLHLCDDPGLGRSSHPSLAAGAALQVTLHKLQFDYYPYHLATGDRNRWPGYRESASPHSQWLRQSLTAFRGSLLSLLDTKPQKSSVSDEYINASTEPSAQQTPSSPLNNYSAPSSGNTSPARALILNQLAKLMTTCVILRLEDFTLFKVTTGERKETPKAFICGDRERFTVPDEVRALHVEFTNFYYPGNMQFPVPSPKLYMQVNPVKVTFDLPSCLWCNSFVLNLLSCIKTTQVANMEGENDLAYIDVTVEAIMPRVVVESAKEHPGQRDRPRSLQAQVSRATITNSQGASGGGGELTACLTAYAASSLLQTYCCTDTMLKHAAGEDKATSPISKDNLHSRVLWGSPRIVWCVKLEPVWADFCGARASPNKPTPFLDAVPFTLWVYLNLEDDQKNCSNEPNQNVPKENSENTKFDDKTARKILEEELKIDGEADMQVVAHCSQLVSLQLNHYQYLLILRLAERLTELAAFLALDAARVSGPSIKARSMIVGCIIPQVEITLVLPSCCPGKESSRDLDSVLPDSSSLIDLHQNTGSGTLCNQPHGNGSSNVLSQSSLERHSAYISSTTLLPSDHQQFENNLQPLNNQCPTDLNNSGQESGDWTDINKEVHNVSGHSHSNKDSSTNIPNLNPFAVSVRRGLTTFMNSVEAALKPSDQNPGISPGPSPNTAPSIADQWDSLSVASSDSDRYVMVQLAGEQDAYNAFKLWDGAGRGVDGAVEVAAEVVEHSSSPSERSLASSCRRRDLVSMSTFKLKHVEVLQLSRGFYSQIFANVGDVFAEECSSIPWDELQSKFATRSRGWSDSVNSSDSQHDEVKSKINVHLDHYPHCSISIPYNIEDSVSLEQIMGSFSQYMGAAVHDINLTLNMSTVMGLTDLIEDEIINPPIPIDVSLENICLKLNEDRPASNISSPGAIPIHVKLSGMKLYRSIDGTIIINPSVVNETLSIKPALQGDVKQLSEENNLLKRRLNALERLALENDSLRRSKEEIDILKALLLTAQDQVAALLDEKVTLLDTVRNLQEQASGVDVRGAGSIWTRHNKR